MNKRNLAIMKWVRERRPDLEAHFKKILESETSAMEGPQLILVIGFEAGREFQHQNPDLEPNDPSQY